MKSRGLTKFHIVALVLTGVGCVGIGLDSIPLYIVGANHIREDERCLPDWLFACLHQGFEGFRPLVEGGNHPAIKLAVEHQAHEPAVLPSDDGSAGE